MRQYRDGSTRAGCWACNAVFGAFTSDEAELHKLPCPQCEQLSVHAFDVFGAWPSEYGELPPCEAHKKSAP